MAQILLVDDDPLLLEGFEQLLQDEGYEVVTAASGTEALDRLPGLHPQCIVMDVRLPGMDGLSTLKAMRSSPSCPPVLIMTAYGTTDTAIEAMKLGAFDYILKPFEIPKVLSLIARAVEAGERQKAHDSQGGETGEESVCLVGSSAPMQKLYKAIGRVAPTDVQVLLRGESGTGKELVARSLWKYSPRADRPFVVINCTTLNEKGWEFLFNSPSSPLLENHITLYFQDIGKLAYRNLQELLYYSNQISLKTRVFLIFSCIVSPQNVPPPAIQSFSAEMGCVGLSVIPLRSRADEIPSLANLYLNSLNASLGKQIIGLAPNAMDQLIHYSWPDNFTEFKAVLSELAALASSSYILNDSVTEVLLKERTLHHAEAAPSAENPFSGKTLEQIISAAINQTLSDCGGNQTLAAKQLGISRSTLWRHLN